MRCSLIENHVCGAFILSMKNAYCDLIILISSLHKINPGQRRGESPTDSSPCFTMGEKRPYKWEKCRGVCVCVYVYKALNWWLNMRGQGNKMANPQRTFRDLTRELFAGREKWPCSQFLAV